MVMVLHQILKFAALIVKLKEISLEKSIKFWKTVLISVSSHIDALLFKETVKLFGRPLVNFKLTLNSIAQSLVAIFATETSINLWPELNSKSIFVMNVQMFYWCAKFAIKNTEEKSSTTINASKIFTLRSLRLTLMM